MQSKPPIVSSHRLARLETVARLWLVRFAAYLITAFGVFPPLSHAAERYCHRLLDRHARFVCCLVFLRAMKQLEKAPRPRGYRHYTLPTNVTQRANISYSLRAYFGAALRKKLRRGGIGERIATMNAILADMESAAADLAHRLRRGLTRLRPIRLLGPPALAAPKLQRRRALAGILADTPLSDTS